MKIVTVPNQILTLKASKVFNIDKKIEKLASEMIVTLNGQTDPPGVGLAAPQIGVSLEIFIIKPTEKSTPEVFVNPQILEVKGQSNKGKTMPKKNKKSKKLEGCLSIPQIWGQVGRAARVQLEYQDLAGRKIKKWFTGFAAIIIQHEIDHLAGVLFTQRVLEQGNKLFKEEEGKLKEYEI